ncbi:MAG: hypothetical protein O6853_07680 [Actinobacteria bacterium]|nr:hypothetical protein [Actinomycetota bacterium]
MADSDSAFLWETEALRSSKPAAGSSERSYPVVGRDDPDWLTLREATELTGIPISTLRKWARHENVPTYLNETPVGQLRMVSLRGIYQRADELGRGLSDETLARVEIGKPARAEPPTPAPLLDPEPIPATPATPATPDEADNEPAIPEGTMLVPLDAWNKILLQLGNLHEAGQQLAEARERAAKAETETTFLRERLTEVRDELAEAKNSASRPPIVVEPVSAPDWDEPDIDEPDIDEPLEEDDSSSVDIPVRNLGDIEPPDEPLRQADQDALLTLPSYSLAMMRHVYTTWRGRPRR